MQVRNLIALASCALLIACTDDKAAQKEQTRQQLMQTIHNVAQADKGYVPQGGESETQYLVDGQAKTLEVADLAIYRQEKLAEPAKDLEAVLTEASDSEQGSARRFLADLRASRVRYQTHQAMLHWAELSGKQATLLRYLAAVQWADSRQKQLTQDDPTELIEDIRLQKTPLRDSVEELERLSGEAQTQVEQLKKRIEDLYESAGIALARSQQLQADAMSAKGEQRYALYQQSSEQQRLSDQKTAMAQISEIERDVKQSELHHMKVRLELTRQQLKGMDQRLVSEEQRLNETKQKLLETEADKAQSVKRMVEFHNSIAQAYAKNVDAVLRSSVEELATVVSMVDKAASSARGPARQGVLAEKLAYLMEQTYVLSSYAVTTADYERKLKLIVDQSKLIMPEHTKSFSAKLEAVSVTHKEIVARTEDVMSQARTLVEELKGSLPSEDHPLAEVVANQASRLEGYDRRLKESIGEKELPGE